jgi:isocitrate/isopropylmalate dehydrogenase
MKKNYRIAAIPGDGIGKEVLPEGIRVLQAGRWHRSPAAARASRPASSCRDGHNIRSLPTPSARSAKK